MRRLTCSEPEPSITMPRSGQLEEMMKTEAMMRMITAHNKHENLRWSQWGGTGVIAYGDLAV